MKPDSLYRFVVEMYVDDGPCKGPETIYVSGTSIMAAATKLESYLDEGGKDIYRNVFATKCELVVDMFLP